QLDAAKIEREISPREKSGTVPERQLRELKKLPSEYWKIAWDRAVSHAPDGVPTMPQVEDVVSRLLLEIKSEADDEATRGDAWTYRHTQAPVSFNPPADPPSPAPSKAKQSKAPPRPPEPSRANSKAESDGVPTAEEIRQGMMLPTDTIGSGNGRYL